MPRMQQLIGNVVRSFNFRQIEVALDIGSFYTRIMVDGQLVFNQPTCFLKDLKSDAVLAVGEQAYAIWGKEPAATQVYFPIKQGVVYDRRLFVQFIESVLKQIRDETDWPMISRIKVKAALPADATSLDQKIFRLTLSEAGLNGTELINRVQAVVSQLQANDNTDSAQETAIDMIVLDVGDQTTELGVLSRGNVTTARTLGFGSRSLTRAIQNYFKREHDLVVSFHHATRLKHRLPNILMTEADAKVTVRGVDVMDNLVVTRTVNVKSLKPLLTAEIDRLYHDLKRSFSSIKSERLLSALENGLYLTGGGSLLTGFEEYLAQQLQVTVMTSKNPFTEVVTGTYSLISK